jgi:hypothetical protein
MHWVSVGDGQGRHRKTYMIAFIDDATRVIPYAAFAENTVAFLPVFKQALVRRGLAQRLYLGRLHPGEVWRPSPSHRYGRRRQRPVLSKATPAGKPGTGRSIPASPGHE